MRRWRRSTSSCLVGRRRRGRGRRRRSTSSCLVGRRRRRMLAPAPSGLEQRISESRCICVFDVYLTCIQTGPLLSGHHRTYTGHHRTPPDINRTQPDITGQPDIHRTAGHRTVGHSPDTDRTAGHHRTRHTRLTPDTAGHVSRTYRTHLRTHRTYVPGQTPDIYRTITGHAGHTGQPGLRS